ncbi:putative cytochrome c oxidase subunit VIa [Phyllosticta citrichinensis]|uniref:Cytochrome c oxidase subunit n=1 Tax=Phyllosticta citrichinensis TaxID=1130410 RepID=A0ABR1XF56_9PEZI
MFPQRAIARASPLLRAAFRRPYSAQTGESGFTGAADNAFNRERAAVKHHAAESSELWRKLSIYFVIPCVMLGGANAYRLWNEHWEHAAHAPPKEEQVEYDYQNIRTKNFFWGDGDKTLFWNDKLNYHKKE